jgi:hypothetical protein
MAETIDFIASSFFLLPTSIGLLPSAITAKDCLLLQNFNILGPSIVDVTPYFGKKTRFLPKS